MKWSRSDREGGDRARATPYGTANGLASPSASRPLRVSAGLRACELEFIPETAPSRASRAQWCMAVSVSLTVAWAAPALHSSLECSPASRFTPGAQSARQGHLRRRELYARPIGAATRQRIGPSGLCSVWIRQHRASARQRQRAFARRGQPAESAPLRVLDRPCRIARRPISDLFAFRRARGLR
jgi:hypothetical protein